MNKNNRIGEININTFGNKMKIVEYNNSTDIVIEFDNGYTVNTTYGCFKSGHIKSPYCKTVYGIGYKGEGSYEISKNRKNTIHYRYWIHMIERCYYNKYKDKFPTYEGCIVCEEWHNYQNFAKWFDDNYYNVDKERMDLDKDILVKNNKVYSPDTCVFVPQSINKLFVRNIASRNGLPIGVVYFKRTNKYRPQISKRLGERKYSIGLGYYKTVEEAFQVYKKEKEQYIKEMANHYKDKIPNKLYKAMYSYKIEIDD